MDNKDYREKIRKLLALAESPNEHEAKAALLKARQLMAEHKLTERDCKDVEKQEVKDIRTDITCSKRRNPWIIDLSAIIGENYCCRGYRIHGYGRQTQEIGFVGFEDDVEICVEIFKYAVDCVLSGVKQIRRENACYSTQYAKRLSDSFGYGFVRGVSEAFEKQQEANEAGWGLVLVAPKEVQEATQHWKNEKFQARTAEEISAGAYARGYYEGKEFDPAKRIS